MNEARRIRTVRTATHYPGAHKDGHDLILCHEHTEDSALGTRLQIRDTKAHSAWVTADLMRDAAIDVLEFVSAMTPQT
jgi:hypothetical protein